MPENVVTIPLKVRFEMIVDGKFAGTSERALELSADFANLLDSEPRDVFGEVDFKGAIERQGDLTVRYPQEPHLVRLQLPPAVAREALVEGRELRADVVLRLETSIAEGKEVVRDPDGQIAGVIERTFADVVFAERRTAAQESP